MAQICPPVWAHWRHLANTIELVLPSVHLNPQPKRQIDRFSRFCTAHGKKCLYFTMGAPIQHKCSFLWGSGTYVTHDSLDPCEPTTQTTPRSVQPLLHRWPQSVLILYNGSPVFHSKLPLPMGYLDPNVTQVSLGPPESSTQTPSRSLLPFCRAY